MSQSDEKAQQVDQPQSVKELASAYQTQKVEYVPILDTGNSYVLEISKKLIQRNGNIQISAVSNDDAPEPDNLTDPADIAAQKELHRLFEKFDVVDARIVKNQTAIRQMREQAHLEMAELKQLIAGL